MIGSRSDDDAHNTSLDRSAGACFFAFPAVNKGERYLVYGDPAYGAERWSVVTVCNRTTAIKLGLNPRLANPDAIDAYADIKILDAITGRVFTIGDRRTQRGRV